MTGAEIGLIMVLCGSMLAGAATFMVVRLTADRILRPARHRASWYDNDHVRRQSNRAAAFSACGLEHQVVEPISGLWTVQLVHA